MIPKKFKEKMMCILGDDYPAFIDAIENRDAVRGLRVNLIKTNVESFIRKFPLKIEAIPYADNGFILREEAQMGASPYHHAGMVYMQDPGAMASAASLEIKPDWWVADLCSAPGGKSSQIAERLDENGFLLSNEYVPKRAKIIVSNFERLGIKNAIVTSLDTAEIAKMYSGMFNLVVADAPCSGEGMFRKSAEAVEDWSPENVELCQRRQGEILNNAVRLVAPGGYLLYSTCTYSPEENEEVITRFLGEHKDFALVRLAAAVEENTLPGLQKYAGEDVAIEYARRFYPHVSEGEGQFVALMQRDENSEIKQTILYKDESKPLSKQEQTVVDKFIKEALVTTPKGRVTKVGENIVLIPHSCPIPKHGVFMSGVLLGDIKGSTLVPSHQFFSAYGKLFREKLNLTENDERLKQYLAGEEIEDTLGMHGWCAVLFEGAPLGGGKASSGRIKNHYPKGLRTR